MSWRWRGGDDSGGDDPFDEERWRLPDKEEDSETWPSEAATWHVNGSHSEDEGAAWDDDTEPLETVSGRWPLDPRGLFARERWLWFAQLWADACMLRERYRLGLRSGWWEDAIQVEALAALAAWVERYDSGEWDDPPGKLALLYDIERVAAFLRDGLEPFSPERDRPAFLRYLIAIGCQPPPDGPGVPES